MKSNEKNYRHVFLIWLKLAEEDFSSAEALLEKKIYNQVCFHCQQAAEKILKAFLKSKGFMPPKIHNLLELLEMCIKKDAHFVVLREGCEYLSRFYVSTRYPDALVAFSAEGLPNAKEAREALKFAKDIMAFLKSRLLGLKDERP